MKAPSEFTKTALFSNPTAFARKDWHSATIPFKKGEWFGDDSKLFALINGAGEPNISLRPFGEKYSDGSQMFGELMVPLSLGAYQQTVLQVKVSPTPFTRQPFFFGDDLIKKLNRLKIEVPFILPDGTTYTFSAGTNFTVVEEGYNRVVIQYLERVGNYVVKFYMYVYKGQDYVPYSLRITGSDPRIPGTIYPVSEIKLRVQGCQLDVMGWNRRGVLVPVDQTPGWAELVLFRANPQLEDGYFGDGASQRWDGNLYFLGENDSEDLFAATQHPAWGISLDWDSTNTFSFLKRIPKSLTDENSSTNYVFNKYAEYEQYLGGRGYLWDDLPLGMTKTPSQTGSQDDIVLSRLLDVVGLKRPELLKHYYFFTNEEAMRPHHYCEVDGTPVKASNHPDWITWSQTTFTRISKDLLGKNPNAFPMNHGWEGKDDEHDLSNLIAEVALLIPRYELIDELNSEAEVYLAGHTLPSEKPGWFTSYMGVNRAVSRTFQSATKSILVTGNAELKKRLTDRFLECIEPLWVGRSSSPRKPLQVVGPDNRIMPLYRYTTPWQELLVPVGLEMLARLLEFTSESDIPERIRTVAKTVAANSMKDGWRITRDGEGRIIDAKIGHGLRWFDENPGVGITDEQYFDTTRTFFVPADYLQLWAVPAMELLLNDYKDFDGAATTRAQELFASFPRAAGAAPFDEISYWQGL